LDDKWGMKKTTNYEKVSKKIYKICKSVNDDKSKGKKDTKSEKILKKERFKYVGKKCQKV
jgi:hypothetical protein